MLRYINCTMLSADNGAINALPTVYICELGCCLVNGTELFFEKASIGHFDTILEERWGIQPHLLLCGVFCGYCL